MNKLFYAAFCIFASLSASGYTAANALMIEDSVARSYNLGEVVVTATKTPLELKNTPVITRVISSNEIERSGAKTIEEVLTTELAGVEFHQAGYGTSITFQGFDARYVLFMIDGERIAGETYGNIDYAKIPLVNIERIEVVRGASSVLYGSNAMGAVVNIITKRPSDGTSIAAFVRYNGYFDKSGETITGETPRSSLDIPNINGDLYAGLNFGKLNSQTSLAYEGSDAYRLVSRENEDRHYDNLTIVTAGMGPPSTKMVQDTTISAPANSNGLSISGWRSYNASQKFSYEFSPKFKLSAGGGYYTKERFDFSDRATVIDPLYPNVANDRYESSDNVNFKASAEYSPNISNTFTFSYNNETTRRVLHFEGTETPKQKHIYNIPRVVWTSSVGSYNRLTVGTEYVAERLNFDLNSEGGYGNAKSMDEASLFAQDEISTNLPLSFVVGARADYSDQFGWGFTPSLSAKYNFLDNYSLRANYSKGYRAPTMKELYMSFLVPMGGGPQMYVTGNPDLDPEHSQYFSLAAEYIEGNTNVSVTGFASLFRDKIEIRRTAGATPMQTLLLYNNISKINYYGFEFIGRTRIADGLFVTANYNYVYQKEFDDASASDYVPSTEYIFASPHTATLAADYSFEALGAFFNIDLSGRFVGEKEYEDMMPVIYTPSPGNPGTKVYSGNYTATHEAYTIWNLAATAKLNNGIALTLGMENLFDYTSPVINFNSCTSPGRNAFVKLAYLFNKR